MGYYALIELGKIHILEQFFKPIYRIISTDLLLELKKEHRTDDGVNLEGYIGK